MLRKVTPSITVVVALLADAVAAVVAALFYGLVAAVALGLTAGVAQAMGKISLDATIQRDVPERNRTSAFARSETLLQLSWVVGGFIGIARPAQARRHLGPWPRPRHARQPDGAVDAVRARAPAVACARGRSGGVDRRSVSEGDPADGAGNRPRPGSSRRSGRGTRPARTSPGTLTIRGIAHRNATAASPMPQTKPALAPDARSKNDRRLAVRSAGRIAITSSRWASTPRWENSTPGSNATATRLAPKATPATITPVPARAVLTTATRATAYGAIQLSRASQ